MDIPRDPKPKTRKRIIQIAAGILALILVTGTLRSLAPAAPTVDRNTIWVDTVEQGTMIRQVRGPGTLVPEQSRWITALTAGRVERILVLPGTEISADDVLLTMSNPDVEMQLLQAQQQITAAEAQLVNLRATLENQRLAQVATVNQVRRQHAEARRDYETNRRLHETNPDLVAAAELTRTREEAEELAERVRLEEERLEVLTRSVDDQVSAQRAQVERLQAMVRFNQQRVTSMEVQAGVDGVLSELPVQEGQWVQSGGTLARVVQPGRLKAELRINQTQAQDIAVGQRAVIDTRNDTIEGQVTRIDPSVQGGTVTIDVTLPDSLPRSARPDQNVDGNVIIEHLEDVVHVGKPTFGQADSRVGIFRLTPDGEHAERVIVEFGRSSVNEIEVREGLRPGDVVILSDMSQWDGYDRVRIR